MNNLLQAEWYRYKKSKLFSFALLASIVTGAVYGWTVVDYESFDDMFIVPLFVIQAAFISLTIGRDYADGTIRNKIIAGKTKSDVYFARLIMSWLTTAIFTLACLLPFVAITFSSILTKLPASILLWTLLGFVLLNFVWSSLFTIVSTLITSRETASITNFICVIVIMFGAYQVESMLGQPAFTYMHGDETNVVMTPAEVQQVIHHEFAGSYYSEIDEKNVVTYYKIIYDEQAEVPNANYIDGPLRTLLQAFEYMLPHGQINVYVSYLTSLLYVEHADEDIPIHTFPLYSFAMLIALTASGFLAFRKKDLK